MRVIGVGRIETYVDGLSGEDASFFAAWIAEAKAAQWYDPAEVEDFFPLAQVFGSNCIFHIAGGRHALATTINYDCGIILIRSVEGSERHVPAVTIATCGPGL